MAKPGEEESASQEESTGAKVLSMTMMELDHFLDIPLTISVELGHTSRTVREIVALQAGSVVELNKLVGEPMEIYINGLLTARGEVVVVNEKFGIRVTDVIDPLEIIRFSL
ncbi:MAG: flagellar motor switch protein FliN [Nitrospinae bacterium]|nr:flagellar motor switch protein FliN [Nitrospinota bacterium]MBF0634771.1 flagellar motor switch protein FliN [Nitrospinota bacterium]